MDDEADAVPGNERGHSVTDELDKVGLYHRCCPAIMPSAKHTTRSSAGTNCIASSALHTIAPYAVLAHRRNDLADEQHQRERTQEPEGEVPEGNLAGVHHAATFNGSRSR